MKKSKTDIVIGWLGKAGRDLEVAKRELSLTQPFTDIICFHAQQAAEKIMKAYLIHLGIEFSKTHDIEDLVIQAGKKDLSILQFKDKGSELTAFAVESRYPEFNEPSLHDTKAAVIIAEKFKQYVIEKIKNEDK
ncbi:MAG: HEPN domain-containing protein [Candidatus Humimicrobiaceae bacterium]